MTLAADLLTYAEAAHELRTSVKTVQRRVQAGHLRPVRLPGSTRPYIQRRELEAYVAATEPARRGL